MYKILKLNKKNMDNFKALSLIQEQFNKENQDFFNKYKDLSFTRQLFLRQKVRLLHDGKDYTGFIWYEPINNTTIIKSMFSMEKNSEPYKTLINSIKSKGSLTYKCTSNDYNFSILQDLGFEKGDGIIEMELTNFNFHKSDAYNLVDKDKISFRQFRRGLDENLRCNIQNEVFYDKNRVPLTVNDIFYEESQRYYFEKGSVFIYVGEVCVGYGQIIIEDKGPYVVNVGILKKFQGLKYGKMLMEHLLDILEKEGFKEVSIRVKSDNFKALNIYSSLGFIDKKQFFTWELKR